MGRIILVTGGARSGKSRFAETLALGIAGRATYIATAEAWDDEMRARIADHQARRGAVWRTVNAPRDLPGALAGSDGEVRLVDCLTLWLSNLMLSDSETEAAGAALVATLTAQTSDVVLVTNEVGAGIVPENALARAFRDAAGALNQRVAAVADEVWFVVSGCPVKVK